MSEERVYYDHHVGCPETSWTEYADPDVITIACATQHMTAQAIADMIHKELQVIASINWRPWEEEQYDD